MEGSRWSREVQLERMVERWNVGTEGHWHGRRLGRRLLEPKDGRMEGRSEEGMLEWMYGRTLTSMEGSTMGRRNLMKDG